MSAQVVRPSVLRLAQPAGRWLDAFPIGNGRIGAMVFGGTSTERLGLNHEDLWRGVTRYRTTEPKHQHLPEIRQKLLEGEWIEGTELATRYLSGHEKRVQPYQPVGDLTLGFPGHDDPAGYHRTLDLADGTVVVEYRVGDVTYRREAIVSADHGVMALRLTADRPGAIDANIGLSRIEDNDCTLRPWSERDVIGFEGRFVEGITFAAAARVVVSGGKTESGGGASFRVSGADDVTLVLGMAVDYDDGDAAAQCLEHLNSAPADFDALLAAHLAEHRPIFDRVALEVNGDPGIESLPLEERLRRLRAGEDDPGLVALYFQFGRYLLISSSRRCRLPANLQGIWNEELRPPWESDLHNDVNIQMNYWPAEVCNLAECAEPLFDYMERCLPEGKKAARDLYDCRGIFICIQTDAWGRVTPESPGWDVWTGAAAWLAQHMWWRYEHARDLAFLGERAYPFMKLVAEFYEDYLVRDDKGRLVTVPSQSPENYFVGGAVPVSLCVGATMDFILIREILERCIAASERLGVDAGLRPGWEAILRDLPPFQAGRHGQLQEWLEDFEEGEPGHRHYSHLVGVYPGEMMTADSLPDMYRAARVSLERRLAAGGGHTGWSRAWTAGLWARFADGAEAYEHLRHLIGDFATESLLDLHPPQIFQIEGNLGGTAAVAELLLQSHGGAIRLLPALPPQWRSGSVRGLRARGGFVVDMIWRDSALQEASIASEIGGPCRIALPDRACEMTLDGEPVAISRDSAGCAVIETVRGQSIGIRPIQG